MLLAKVCFIACKTSPISRNNARYDNAIKASLMMALQWRRAAVKRVVHSEGGSINAMAVFYGGHALGWQVPIGQPAGWLCSRG